MFREIKNYPYANRGGDNIRNSKKILAILMTVLITFGFGGVSVFASDETVTIAENGSYTVEGTVPVIVKSGIKADVTLKNADISAIDTSAFTVEPGAEVTLILEGVNSLKADKDVISAGIYVPAGAKLTIKGSGTLNVTGGKYGAGIGSVNEVVSGAITIDDGVIYAAGGERGAGIGSGYHASAGTTVINGGTITAIGSGGGAGIGTGYGTSGGGEGKVGIYSGGDITITGGSVYAASFPMDFSKVDPMNPLCMTEYDTNSFAAGIGGGYGSSSGNISITGGEVIALGSCGGAGIGSGRGTSKANNYDQDAFFTNISISGNAKVTAMATDDVRNYAGGGAAIGTGRGTHTGGTISITGNADVTAIASPFSAAIGAGSNKSPVDGSVPAAENVEITKGVSLYAVSDGTHYAVDTACGTKTFSQITADIQQILFDSNVLNTDAPTEFTLRVNGKNEKNITVPAGMKSVATDVAEKGVYYVLSGDKLYGVQTENTVEYPVDGTLSEQTCVKLIEFSETADDPVDNPGDNPGEAYEYTSSFAYIYGYSDNTMAADSNLLRSEVSAMVHRLVKQNDKLGGFVYNEANEPAFSDIEGEWSRSGIEYMNYKGAFAQGDSVYPYAAVTRGETFKIICLGLDFTDKTNLSYDDYAAILYNAGYIQGDENGNLNVWNLITRAEFCTIYNKIIGRDGAKLVTADGTEITAEIYGFTDLDGSEWYYETMLRATSAYDDEGYVNIELRNQRNVLDDYQ